MWACGAAVAIIGSVVVYGAYKAGKNIYNKIAR